MYNLILAFIAMFIFSACGSSDRDATGGEGSIAFSVDWQTDSSNEVIPPLAKGDSGGFSDNAVSRASSLDCSSSGVSSVSATVYSSSGSTLATGGPWSCSAHSGSITGVSAGTNRKVVFLGKDSNGYVKYKGEQTGITVTDGQTSNAGTITAALFVPTPSLPSDTSTVTNGSFSLSWPSSSTASSYQIQISTDNSFSGTTVDTTVTETSYTPSTLPAGTYYWRIRASDSYGNTSQWSEVWSFTVLPGSSDTTAPTNTTATNFINSGNSSTSSTSVTLTISATDSVGVTAYYASETSTTPLSTASGWVAGTATTSLSTNVSFTLSSGNGTKTVYVWFKDAAGNVSAAASDSITLSVAATGANFKMPDTNQTTSYTNTFGEDHDYTINPPSYTDNGDGTITDNVTGLMWQKQDDATTRTWTDAGTYCSNLTLGVQIDWRLPTRIELISIVDYGTYSPAINTTLFPNTSSTYYWSSTADAGGTSGGWFVGFDDGSMYNYNLFYSFYVRCVRGGQASSSLSDNGNGTVTDSGTNLMWQQGESSAITWESALSFCEGLSLATYTDWRLPNIKELSSVVDDTRYYPAINTTYFPGTISSSYWSSTTYANNSSFAWNVYFNGGDSYSDDKTVSYYVRCVRGGQ